MLSIKLKTEFANDMFFVFRMQKKSMNCFSHQSKIEYKNMATIIEMLETD